jgi:hypothetical protein
MKRRTTQDALLMKAVNSRLKRSGSEPKQAEHRIEGEQRVTTIQHKPSDVPFYRIASAEELTSALELF